MRLVGETAGQRHVAQILDADGFVEMRFDETSHAMNLPSCQPSRRGIAARDGGASFDFDLKERRSSSDKDLGRFTVPLDFRSGGVEQLDQAVGQISASRRIERFTSRNCCRDRIHWHLLSACSYPMQSERYTGA